MNHKGRKYFYNTSLKLAIIYKRDAYKCLESKAYYAGLVAVRASLEALIKARILVDIFSYSKKELEKYNIEVDIEKDLLHFVKDKFPFPNLKNLIDFIYEEKLITKKGYTAAHRIREWGNKIHVDQVAYKKTVPYIKRKTLENRLKDLEIVLEELLDTL